jgi:hypothetical protein
MNVYYVNIGIVNQIGGKKNVENEEMGVVSCIGNDDRLARRVRRTRKRKQFVR